MKLATDEIREIVARALAEDVGSGDVTAEAVVDEGASARATILQKQAGAVFGFEAAAEAFRQAGAEAFDPIAVEGQWRDSVPVTAARSRAPRGPCSPPSAPRSTCSGTCPGSRP